MFLRVFITYVVFTSALFAGWSPKGSVQDEIKCLADNIYFEARNQGEKGQWAIAHVTWNRVNHKLYPNSICEVVWEKSQHRGTDKWVAQFSWTLDGKSDRPREKEAYAAAVKIARTLLITKDVMEDPTNGATHYHADYVNPYWAKSMKLLATVDNHIFYR